MNQKMWYVKTYWFQNIPFYPQIQIKQNFFHTKGNSLSIWFVAKDQFHKKKFNFSIIFLQHLEAHSSNTILFGNPRHRFPAPLRFHQVNSTKRTAQTFFAYNLLSALQ